MSFWAHEAWDGAATPTLPGKQQVVRQGVETLLEICRSDPKSGPGMLEAKQAQEHMHRLEHVGSLLAVILGQYLHRRRSRHRQLLPKLDPSWWFSNESLKPSTFLVDQLVTGIQLSALLWGSATTPKATGRHLSTLFPSFNWAVDAEHRYQPGWLGFWLRSELPQIWMSGSTYWGSCLLNLLVISFHWC
jgi:hypothetical protein